MIPFDLALGLWVIRRASSVFYLLLFEPGFEFTTDLARSIVRQQARLVPYPGLGQACGLQSIFQCIRHISDGHGSRQAPSDNVARVIILNRRQEVSAPTHHSEIGKIGLPQFMYLAGRVLESIRCLHHRELRAGDQLVGL